MNAARGSRAVLQLLALVALEIGVVVLAHRLGELTFLQLDWRDPIGWLAATAPEDVLAALCRLAALAGAYWLLAGTLLYTGARALRVPAAIRAVEWAALPAVRRVADRAVAVTLATSSLVSGAGGVAWADRTPAPPEIPPPVVRVVPGGALLPPGAPVPPPPTAPSAGPATAVPPAPVPAGFAPAPAAAEGWEARGTPTPGIQSVEIAPPAPEPSPGGAAEPGVATPGIPTPGTPPTPGAPSGAGSAPAPAVPAEHMVVAGEDLWTIAAGNLAATTSRAPDDLGIAEVAAYWRQVIDANTATLRSGDPDLVLPGEVIRLPAPAGTPSPSCAG